jgi:hypothetical protein
MSSLRRYLPEHDLMYFGPSPAVYHCHHFNLFLDQTIDDALGFEAGSRLRFLAGREFASPLLAGAAELNGLTTPAEKLELASKLFSGMGHGRLQITADAKGGEVKGSFLHYGYSWSQKYGQIVKRKQPADAFGAGFAAAAAEMALGLPAESMGAHESECVAMKAPGCTFQLKPGDRGLRLPPVAEAEIQKQLAPSFNGLYEEVIQPITKGLRDFTAPVAGDERGLVQAFGVFVTLHLAGYYNRISYEAVQQVEKKAPQSVGVLEDLLRESGHVCVFNTFGGILLSPEWEGMVGPLTGEPLPIITGCMAIARALGFGRWTISEFEPGKRLVVRAPASYESVFYRSRYGKAPRPNEYFLQGACLAIAQLAHRVDWKAKPVLTQDYYNALFRGGPLPWKVEQVKSTACGHPISEVVVTRVEGARA